MITTGQFRFELSNELRVHCDGTPLEAEEFDLDLLRDSRFPPQAWEAPVASWVLARLAYEAHRAGAWFDPPREEQVDGGSYVVDVRVYALDDLEVGGFQLQGNTCGVAILGACAPTVNPREILAEFANLLLADPAALAECVIEVYDPEWEFDESEYEPLPDAEARNRYGWDGHRLLGAENVWCEIDYGAPRPQCYRDYLTLCLQRLHEHEGQRDGSS